MMSGFTTLPTVLASFAASLVEFVEALTVVLAVGAVRGWRWTLIGTAVAVSVLVILVGVFGQSLARVPISIVQVVVGTLLLMFGLRWLRKAILRSAGAIALHDEQAAYSRETATLRAAGSLVSRGLDRVAFATAFKIVMLEGIEVVFIVIAIGAGDQLIAPAAFGAVAAFGVVVCLGIALHRPLAKIPENALKFGVGVLLSAFGTFWVGEGIQIEWPAADWSLLVLILAYFLVAAPLVIFCRLKRRPLPKKGGKSNTNHTKGVLRTLYRESIALFVDDATLAIGILVWAGLAWVASGHLAVNSLSKCALFLFGFLVLMAYSVMRAVRG
jgi:uncharacterized membrane protein